MSRLRRHSVVADGKQREEVLRVEAGLNERELHRRRKTFNPEREVDIWSFGSDQESGNETSQQGFSGFQ